MSRVDEIPGLTFITCATLEEMGLWDTDYCCASCHDEQSFSFHGLFEHRLPTGQTLSICNQAVAELDLNEVERKICVTPELNANDQSN